MPAYPFSELMALSQAEYAALTSALDTALKEAEQTRAERVKDAALIAALRAEIQRLTPPPPPVVASSKITRTFLPRLFGMTIENGDSAPSKARYDVIMKALDWGKAQGFSTYRLFLNPSEVAELQKPTPQYGNVIAYGKSLGFRWLADTIDTIVGNLPDDTKLKEYMDGLKALGCEGVYINDADRAALPLNMLRIMASRLRRAAPDMPIFASLTATADLATYKGIVDWVEIQTFGTPAELTRFLAIDNALPYPLILCLDLRKPLTTDDLKTRAALLKKDPPYAFFMYADLAADYESAPDSEDVVIKELLTALKARA